MCPRGVAEMPRNGWPESIGMAGRNGSEQAAGIDRNQWPEYVGIRTMPQSIACRVAIRRKPGEFNLYLLVTHLVKG